MFFFIELHVGIKIINLIVTEFKIPLQGLKLKKIKLKKIK